MNILLVSEYFPTSDKCEVRGGAEARAFYLAKHLSRLNHNIFVLASREKGQKREGRIGKITVFRTESSREFLLGGSLKRLAFVINSSRFKKDIPIDIVDGQNFLGHFISSFLAGRYKSKKVATYHDTWIGEWSRNIGLPWGYIGEVGERWVLSRDWDRFIAVSSYTRDKLIKNKIPRQKIKIIKNGVDFSLIKKIKVKKEKDPTICYVGRLYPYKKVDVLLEAVSLLAQEIPEIKLKVVGSGPDLPRLKFLTKEMKIKKNVDFVGFVKSHREVFKILKSAHVFSLPSSVEGFGLTTIEAMALGVPYVSSNIPATIEVTENGKGGLIFKKDNPYDLSLNAKKLLTSKELYEAKAHEGLVHSKGYDWEKLAKDLEGVYEELL